MNVEPWMDVDVGDGPTVIVAAVQHLLNSRGIGMQVDGIYGPLTQIGVRGSQRAASLEVTGNVDAATWEILTPTLRCGDRGSHGDISDAVRALQVLDPDYDHGPGLEVDGIFGQSTRSVVRFYQDAWGLGTDGIVGDLTWSHLQTAREGVWQWPLVATGGRTSHTLVVQHLLTHHGHPLVADGVFGPATGEAVRQWQMSVRARFISRTVGFLDWPQLVVGLRRGDVGPAVCALQALFHVSVDGIFGDRTQAAVFGSGTVAGVVGVERWNRALWPPLE